MTFKEIYDRIIPLWGNRLDFSDGLIINSDNAEGFRSTKVIAQWNKIEDEVGTEEPYSELMVWTMYTVFHRHAVKLFKQGITEFHPKDVTKEEIEDEYHENLKDDQWNEELRGYERII